MSEFVRKLVRSVEGKVVTPQEALASQLLGTKEREELRRELERRQLLPSEGEPPPEE